MVHQFRAAHSTLQETHRIGCYSHDFRGKLQEATLERLFMEVGHHNARRSLCYLYEKLGYKKQVKQRKL